MALYINDVSALRRVAQRHDGVWGFDIETFTPGGTPDPWHDESLTLTAALSYGGDQFGFILDHPLDQTVTDELFNERVAVIDEVVSDPKKTISGHSIATFDAIWWCVLTDKERFTGRVFDSRIAHALIEEDSENTLDFLAEKYTTKVKNPDGLNRKRLHKEDPLKVLTYNMRDAEISEILYYAINQTLDEEGQSDLFSFMSQVSDITQGMTLDGAYIDTVWAEQQLKEIRKEIAEKEAEFRALVGDVNIRSTKQLTVLLYETLRLPVMKSSNKTGKPSADKEAFLMLKNKARINKAQRNILDRIEELRGLYKLDGTYLTPTIKKHRKRDGRLHTTFNIGKGIDFGGTVTGRLSSANPNLQNQPRDARLRGVIVPTPGMVMFDADYSQLELRILAWYSQDPEMLEAFDLDQDLHARLAARIAGISYEEVLSYIDDATKETNYELYFEWKEKRTQAKRTNFGIPYGIGAFKLMQQIWDSGASATESSSNELLQYWKSTFNLANERIEGWKDEVIQTGRIVTPTGRVRHLAGGSRYHGPGKRVLRQGINFPIQSLAADITFVALYLLHQEFEREGGARLTLTVHDSIMGEYFQEDWPDMRQRLETIMVDDTLAFMQDRWGIEGIPLKVDVDVDLERWSS